ncbi:MAG: T9SS type A sorting domain-containing protein [Bacteroidota bacterium]
MQLVGGTFRTDIALEGLPAGLYLVTVRNGRQVWQERVVVE